MTNLVLAGTVAAYAGPSVQLDSGWLLCDGRPVDRTQFESLYKAIGTTHGVGNNVSTFNLPDYRGRFLRGVDDPVDSTMPAAGRDPNVSSRTEMADGGNSKGSVGSVQEDALQGHKHQSEGKFFITDAKGMINPGNAVGARAIASVGTPISDGVHGEPRLASETRCKNAYVNFIIKY